MKTSDEIRNRVVELLEVELDRRVQLASERLPHLCVHNHRQPLDTRRNVDGAPNAGFNRVSSGVENGRALPVIQEMGLCMLGAETPEQWTGTICDEPIDAKRCPVFTPLGSKEVLFAKFTEELQDPLWIEANLPEVASLLWVLETLQVPRISWWKKFWFRVMRITIEPVLPSFDVTKLLPPAPEEKRS